MSSTEPHWMVRGLSDRSGVRLSVRAVNERGESEPATLTATLLHNPHKQTALAPLQVELSPVVALVLCAAAAVVTATALAAVVMCFRYCKRHDDEDKAERKQDVTAKKPLVCEDCESGNPDIIPIESKISDTCSNMSSAAEYSCVRPLLSRNRGDTHEPGNCESYCEPRACTQYVLDKTTDCRQYQPHLQMHGPSMPNIRRNGQTIVPNMSHIPNNQPEECELPCSRRYEDWLKYKNSLPLNSELQFLSPSPCPRPSLYAQPRPLRLVDLDMLDPNCRTASPLSTDFAVYYSTSPHERDNTLPPLTQPDSSTGELTNTTAESRDSLEVTTESNCAYGNS